MSESKAMDEARGHEESVDEAKSIAGAPYLFAVHRHVDSAERRRPGLSVAPAFSPPMSGVLQT